MKKLVNDVHDVVKETLEGFALAHADLVEVHLGPDYVTRKDPKGEGKVGIISGGGSGNGIKALNLSAELAAEAEGTPIKPWQVALTLATAIGLALLLFVVVPHMLTIGLGALSISGGVEGLSFHLWDGLLKFAMFIGYIASISFVPLA